MGRLESGLIGLFAMGVLPQAAYSQTTAPISPTLTATGGQPAGSRPVDLSGTTALDVINLSPLGPGTPLRNGNIVPNSETVQLEGRTLSPGLDYMMDYAVGVVYLKVSQRAGQSLIVGYRYKAGAAAPTPGSNFMGYTPFTFALMPGSLNMISGLGMAERGEDGSVMSSNVLGWNNAFKFGGSSLSGLYAIGDRSQIRSSEGFEADPGSTRQKSTLAAGQSQMILQNLKSSLLGGSASFDYQSISKGFTGFGSASAAGMDDAAVNQLKAEKGLTRLGYSFNNMNLAGLNFSNSHREIKDGASGINWDTLGFSAGSFKMNWGRQNVDSKFNRFSSLEESNKDQLGKEAGIARAFMSTSWSQKFATLSYSNNRIIDDLTKKAVNQQIFGLDTSKLKFNLTSEAVDGGFSRMSSLLAPEQAAFGKEAGTRRRTLDLTSSFLGNSTPIAFNEKTIDVTGARYIGNDVSVTNKLWSLQHSDRRVSTNFNSINTMTDPEIDASVKSIAAMYGADVKPTPGDRAQFIGTHGLDRSFNGFSTNQVKNWQISAGQIDFKGATDKAQVDSFTAASKNTILSIKKENLGTHFNELTTMMDLEKQRLGLLPGLNRTDVDLAVNAGKRKFELATLDATTPSGLAQRATLNYTDPKLDAQIGVRKVSSGFTDAPNLVDPGKDVFAQLRGFTEGDAKIKWQILPNMTLNSLTQNAYNAGTNASWLTRNNVLDWAPDKNTQVNVTELDSRSTDPIYTLFDSSVSRLTVNRTLGKYGTLKLLEEKDEFSGLNATSISQDRKYLAYEGKINSTTSFKTEQTITNFANGLHEDISSNTISKDLSKRAGVSVTNTEISRQGSNDESHRNYGFWYDLGGGMRLSYGYAKQVMPEDQSSSSSGLTLGKTTPGQAPNTPVQAGQLGAFNFGAGYFANQWEAGNRTQTNGNLSLSTAKPFKLGWFKDVNFGLNLDTAADHATMQHENKLVAASGKLGSNIIGYEYKSQMDPTGLRAIDRSIKLTTDPSDKKKLNVGFSYKSRTTTTDQQIVIRDYNFTFRPIKNFLLTNQVQTNPEVANTNVLLGSIPQASKSDKWKLDYKQGANLTVGGSWEELKNDQMRSVSRTTGLNMKLFEKTGSPITIFYGFEEANSVNLWRTTQRYSIEYDQKPAANQTFSLLLGSLSYEHSVPIGSNPRSLTLRVNYQFSFW